MDAPHHRHQMRHEGDRHRPAGDVTQALLDFRQMPVPAGAVGLEALRRLRQQHRHLGAASGAAGAAVIVYSLPLAPLAALAISCSGRTQPRSSNGR